MNSREDIIEKLKGHLDRLLSSYDYNNPSAEISKIILDISMFIKSI